MGMSSAESEALRSQLAAYLAAETGSSVVISNVVPLAGGASRDSWAFDACFNGGTVLRFVLRRDLPTTMNADALSRAQEFRLMAAAHAHGVKVAQVCWLCDDPAPLGMPFLIMSFVEGISVGRKVISLPGLAEARQNLGRQMAEQLALIHTLDWRSAQLDFLREPRDGHPAQNAIFGCREVLDTLGAHLPAAELVLRWLECHAPSSDALTLVHGDFRLGNLLIDKSGLAAVIDWEFAHVGDPHEELGYLCMRDWRFGSDALRASGISEREPFLLAYEQTSGAVVNRRTVTWWEILGNIRWAIICLNQAQRHLSGEDPSVELASLGRRSVEMQAEALRLIKRGLEAQA
jgi:aminoglycoside phosphotransferase (APT) family kinase protein